MTISNNWKMNTIERIDINQFAERNNLVIEVNERSPDYHNQSGDNKYYAMFVDCDVKDGGCLVGMFGNGATPEDAVREYAESISNKTIVYKALSEERKEIRVPYLCV